MGFQNSGVEGEFFDEIAVNPNSGIILIRFHNRFSSLKLKQCCNTTWHQIHNFLMNLRSTDSKIRQAAR